MSTPIPIPAPSPSSSSIQTDTIKSYPSLTDEISPSYRSYGPAGVVLQKFHWNEAVVEAKSNKWFRIHAFVALGLSAASFLFWMVQAFMTNGWPWFTYVWGLSVLTLSTHFYLFEQEDRQWLPLHVMFFGVINACAFVSWAFSGNHSHAWFLEVFVATGGLLAFHGVFEACKDKENIWFYLHATGYAALNTLFFVTWLDAGKGFPWFVFTILGFAIPLHVHYCLFNTLNNLYWRTHVATFTYVQLILFFAWMTTGMPFAGFFFPLLIWGVVIGLHAVYLYRYSETQISPTQDLKTVKVEPQPDAKATAATRNFGISLQR